MDKKRNVYTTTNGVEIEIRAISLSEMQMAQAGIREEYKERGEPLVPPKYKIETFGGGEEWHDHDETTLKTDEDKKAWAEHKIAVARLDAEVAKLAQEFVFEDGLIVELPTDGIWEARMKRRRIKLSDDPGERRTQYILTELLRTPMDIKGCIAEVLKLSVKGADNQAEIIAALDSFLYPVPAKQDATRTAVRILEGENQSVGT